MGHPHSATLSANLRMKACLCPRSTLTRNTTTTCERSRHTHLPSRSPPSTAAFALLLPPAEGQVDAAFGLVFNVSLIHVCVAHVAIEVVIEGAACSHPQWNSDSAAVHGQKHICSLSHPLKTRQTAWTFLPRCHGSGCSQAGYTSCRFWK